MPVGIANPHGTTKSGVGALSEPVNAGSAISAIGCEFAVVGEPLPTVAK